LKILLEVAYITLKFPFLLLPLTLVVKSYWMILRITNINVTQETEDLDDSSFLDIPTYIEQV
jgi:hypothetical protein